MPVVIACPTCQQKVRIGENLLGKQVKCPQCKNPFTAVDPNAVPPPAPTWEAVTPKPEFDFDAPPPPTVESPREEFDEDEAPARATQRPQKSAGSKFIDYLLFRRMITPVVMTVLFYLVIILEIIGGVVYGVTSVIFMVKYSVLAGILGILAAFFGTIVAILYTRILCEIILAVFRVLDNVREINEQLEHGVKTRE